MLLDPSAVGVSPATLQTAEALVAAAIGCSKLGRREVVQEGYLEGQWLPLRDGPAVTLGQITFNTLPLQIAPTFLGPRLTPWAVDFGPYYSRYTLGLGTEGFGWSGYAYSVTYTAGWTSSSVPDPVRTAITLTAQQISAAQASGTLAGVVSEKIGDVMTVYGAQGAQPISLHPLAKTLLAPYRRLRV